MKKIILLLVITLSLAACTDNGKKITVKGTKGEVFYKGEGVTEEDAKKTGEFLKEEFFSSGKEASVQLTREKDTYTIRFVYNKKVYDTLKGIENVFKVIGAQASKEVFGGKKVNIALADKYFKDFATIPYDETVAKKLDSEEGFAKDEYNHDKLGDVNFYWKDISDEEAKRIADYIMENGAFSGGKAELYISKSSDRTIISFPVIESARSDESYKAEIDKVSRQIKDNVFPDAPFTFRMTDERMNTAESWDY